MIPSIPMKLSSIDNIDSFRKLLRRRFSLSIGITYTRALSIQNWCVCTSKLYMRKLEFLDLLLKFDHNLYLKFFIIFLRNKSVSLIVLLIILRCRYSFCDNVFIKLLGNNCNFMF